MKLFISYRRQDSIHAAHRVRMTLQARFGDEAVFIDREIPPGTRWDEHIESMLQASTGVVVIVGDEFMGLLRKSTDVEKSDPMVWEIATALRLNKRLYPVLVGRTDMPEPDHLPPTIRDFSRSQAVFAREPAFDSGLAVLVRSLATAHDRADVLAPQVTAEAPLPVLGPRALLAAALVLAAAWLCGRLILWLQSPATGAAAPFEAALWEGARYGLATALWGLAPYTAYWLVAVLRARASLPMQGFVGTLSAVNLCVVMVFSGSFLLLSTVAGWRLTPLWVFPERPTLGHYALLAVLLLVPAVAAVFTAVQEPLARKLEQPQRGRRMKALHTVNGGVTFYEMWLAASLAFSTQLSLGADPIAVLGYFMLCPTLSLLYLFGWKYSHAGLDIQRRGWELRFLCALVAGLYLMCTLALYAYGPGRVLAG